MENLLGWARGSRFLPQAIGRSTTSRRLQRLVELSFLSTWGLVGAFCVAGSVARAQIVVNPAVSAQDLETYLPNNLPSLGGPGNVTVLTRPRPDYDYLGIHAGTFTIFPQYTGGVGFDSNPRGAPGQAGSAFISNQASVSANSNWSRNSLSASASVDDSRYLQQTPFSRTDDAFALGGRYDVGAADHLLVSGSHSDLHIEPNGIDSIAQQRTIPYQVNVGTASYLLNFSRLSFEPFVNVSQYSYSNVRLGGLVQTNEYLDNVTTVEGVTTRYELSPLRHAVFVIRGAESSFDHPTAGSARRDNNTVSVLGGLDYVADGVWRYRVLAGYQIRQYAASTLKLQTSPVVEADVIWSPSLLTSVELTANRQILNSTDPISPGFTDSLVKVQVEHEYLRNVLLNVHGSTELAEYQEHGGHQTLIGLGAGATWLLNRHQKLALTYDHTKSTSNTRTKFDEDVMLVKFSVGF